VFLDHKYMDNYRDFTVDPVNYKDLNSLSTSILTTYGIETVLEIDADLSSHEQDDEFYDEAV
jgi:alpha-glucosidase (family GH31 glycosyl hydrolase)